MVRKIVSTGADRSALLLRLGLAAVIFPHGAQKLFGWFGGAGLTDTLEFFSGMGIPVVLGALVVVLEFFGPIALLLGAGSRIAASGIGVIMLVAALTVHLPNGFFMNWFGNQAGEGFEFHILALAIAAAVTIQGGGALSVDRALST